MLTNLLFTATLISMFNDLENIIHCPACGERYPQGAGRVVNRKGSVALLHICCQKCRNRALTMIKPDGETGRIMAMGMLTDLDSDEAMKFMKRKPITVDEALEMSEKLESF